MELELKSRELELKTRIEIGGIENGIGIEIPGIGIENWNWIFCNSYHVTNFSFNRSRRGHNLSCDWLLMQKVCLSSSWDIAPCGVVTKDHGEGTLFPLSRQRPKGLKMMAINISSTTMTQTKLLSVLYTWMISGLGMKLSQHISFSLILLICIFRSFMVIHWDKYHLTLLINFMISPHCFR